MVSFWLFAYTDGEFTKFKGIPITTAEVEIGEVFYENLDYGMSISTVFDNNKDTFVGRIKVKLAESGTYYIGGRDYDSYKDTQRVGIVLSNDVNEEIHVYTSIKNCNENGVYRFTIE